ncbi:unnamed protein product [Nippostrongylus brasiliensis]|uniref:ABC transporter domain-containing protein n=1 Tax=Nippostrongylus brasiliensis TaxID=27835 RepID=A0A158R2F8_NIPBR|nr:unnamed protein product [Nippostrongylus brasiliensis]
MFLMAASFRLGGWLVVIGSLTPINVLRVIFPCSFAASGLGYAAAYFPEYVKATFAAGLIFNMLKEEPLIDGMTTSGKKPSIAGAIVLKNIYPPILQVNPGETLALVGPSGCGKSTVISLLERMYDPMEGVVAVDGNDLREVNPSHLRSHMALVSQEPILFDISIRDNIVYGLPSGSVSDEEIHDAARRANIHKFITELPDGYNTRAGEGGTQLSGGQKQRIAIARALIRNPNILLLDEATSALDTESEKLVQEALDKASEGRTCIIVAHRLSTIVNASCIVVVKDGSIVEKGTHQELMQAKGAYWALTQKQSAAAAN